VVVAPAAVVIPRSRATLFTGHGIGYVFRKRPLQEFVKVAMLVRYRTSGNRQPQLGGLQDHIGRAMSCGESSRASLAEEMG
jgi:hypothetical protein